MNPIVKALDELKFRIPIFILREVFKEKGFYNWSQTPISLDEQIKQKVINPRVLVDCNLVGGAELSIPLDSVKIVSAQPNMTVFHIPKDLTQGRSILSVLNIGFMAPNALTAGSTGFFKACSVTPVLGAGQDITNALSPIPQVSTAKVELVAENTVLVSEIMASLAGGFLRCIVMNDPDMSHIQLRTIPAFCRLVELAVKSYIYNNQSIAIDSAYLQGGVELGKFKDIVDSYADAEEMYQEFLKTKWGKISFMNDRTTKNRYLKLMTGMGH